jgi:hypothetical protein
MLLVNAVMANVFETGHGFQKICNRPCIISHFHLIKEMLLVSTTSPYLSSLELVDNAIYEKPFDISNCQLEMAIRTVGQ